MTDVTPRRGIGVDVQMAPAGQALPYELAEYEAIEAFVRWGG